MVIERRKMTIVDIARLAKVSTATVSRVINNGSVRKTTKERVLKVIEKYEYYPNHYAQYLGQRSHGHGKFTKKTGSVSNRT